jgi:putative NIF3 family GTP cyclohydrolase 1 type 2
MGRTGSFWEPVERERLFYRLKYGLGLERLLIVGPEVGRVTKAAVCAGACGDLLDEALAQGIEFYVTGEMRHHDAIKAAAAGMTVACTLHSNSERVTLKRLKERLEGMLPGLQLHLSQADRDPFVIR